MKCALRKNGARFHLQTRKDFSRIVDLTVQRIPGNNRPKEWAFKIDSIGGAGYHYRQNNI